MSTVNQQSRSSGLTDIYNEQSLSAQGFNVSLTANGPAAFAATDNIHAQRRDDALDRVHGNTQEQKDKDRAAMMQAEMARQAYEQAYRDFMDFYDNTDQFYNDALLEIRTWIDEIEPEAEAIKAETDVITLTDENGQSYAVYADENGQFVALDEKGNISGVLTDLDDIAEAQRQKEQIEGNGQRVRTAHEQNTLILLDDLYKVEGDFALDQYDLHDLRDRAKRGDYKTNPSGLTDETNEQREKQETNEGRLNDIERRIIQADASIGNKVSSEAAPPKNESPPAHTTEQKKSSLSIKDHFKAANEQETPPTPKETEELTAEDFDIIADLSGQTAPNSLPPSSLG